MKLNINKFFLIVFFVLATENISSKPVLWQYTDPFTDEESIYVFVESINNQSRSTPAYLKIMFLQVDDIYEPFVAFNSDFISFGYGDDATVELQVRFDKNQPFSINLFYCNRSDAYIEHCRVNKNKRRPSTGFYADPDESWKFLDSAFDYESEIPNNAKKLLIRFPGEKPIEFDLEDLVFALMKMEELMIE